MRRKAAAMTQPTGPGRPTIAGTRPHAGDHADERVPHRRVAPNPSAPASPPRLISDAFHPEAKAGDRDTVARVYQSMFTKIDNRPDAKTLTAEAFVAALDPVHRSASAAKVQAYLLATARTRLTDHRRRTLGSEVITRTNNHTADPVRGGTQTSSQALRQTAGIPAELPKPSPRILALRLLRCCSTPQAAAALGTSGRIRQAAPLSEVTQ